MGGSWAGRGSKFTVLEFNANCSEVHGVLVENRYVSAKSDSHRALIKVLKMVVKFRKTSLLDPVLPSKRTNTAKYNRHNRI